jgi:uncharacterized surface protein with fasciclin (FAS1) repeats
MKFHYSLLSAATTVTAVLLSSFSSFIGGASAQTIVDIASGDGNFETLVAAVTAANLATTLSGPGPFTVFAPTDDIFAALPAGTLDSLLADPSGDLTDILLYHVASGNVTSGDLSNGMTIPTLQGKNITINIVASTDGGNPTVTVNNIPVLTPDIVASNGVIHVIGGILMPPKDIVEIAVGDENFSTLVTAVQQAKLVETLQGDGPFTVFAPINDAFDALPEGTLTTLLADPEGDLKNILLYHVVAGEYKAASITDGLTLTTVLGEDITFSIQDGSVYVNDAKVIIADVDAYNGVIHAIDKVILPPEDEDDVTSAATGTTPSSLKASQLVSVVVSSLLFFAAAATM